MSVVTRQPTDQKPLSIDDEPESGGGKDSPSLQGERVLDEIEAVLRLFVFFTTGQYRLILTTHRVRYFHSRHGHSGVASIMLDHVSFCGTTTVSKPLLLLAAGLVAAFGVWMMGGAAQGGNTATYVCFLGSMVLVLAYLSSRQQLLRIASGGGEITMELSGGKINAKAKAFVDRIEKAKETKATRKAP